MERVLLAVFALAGLAVSETALAHPHYDVAAVAGTSAALPFLLGIGMGIGIGWGIGVGLRGKRLRQRVVAN